MGQTAVEKILSKACGQTVTPGQIVIAHPDLTWIPSGFGLLAIKAMQELGIEKVSQPDRALTWLVEPSFSTQIGESDYHLARWSNAQGIPVIRGGVPTATLLQYVKPGQLVVGLDSHSPTLGALGCISLAVGDSELGVILATNSIWLRTPTTIAFHFVGSLPRGSSAKDAALKIIKDHGMGVAVYKAVEFLGPGLEKMNLWSRLTLCNMSVEMGAKAAFIAPDPATLAPLERQFGEGTEIVRSDENANYEQTYQVNLESVTPMVACPDSLANTTQVANVEGTPVTHAFLGSCTNAWIDDLRAAARILNGKQVARGIRMIVAPADNRTMRQAVAEGLVSTFINAGAVVTHPNCSMCSSLQNTMGPGEVCISSSGRNFKGRMGHPDSKIYVASPETVAASAIRGCITDPRNLEG